MTKTKSIVVNLFLGVFFAAPPAHSQRTITQEANQVQCGNVINMGGGKVNLTCQGLTKDQVKALQTTIPRLLQKLITANAEQYAAIEGMFRELVTTSRGGNLSERTIGLANAMMTNLAERGWQPPRGRILLPDGDAPFLHFPGPTGESAEYRDTWFRNMRMYWRSHFGDAVVGVHDEFAQLHVKDSDLDQSISAYQMETADLMRGAQRSPLFPVNPYAVEDVAKGLVRLAEQVDPGSSNRIGLTFDLGDLSER